MADSPLTMRVDLTGLQRFKKTLNNRSGEVEKAFKKWGVIYSRFIYKRYTRLQKGGGSWAPLQESTIEHKKRMGYTRPRWILYATGQMKRNLNLAIQGLRGVRSKKTRLGMVISYGSGDTYPNGKTVAEIMRIHQRGGGNLPQRKIIVPPDVKTRAEMREVMVRAVQKEIDKG